MSHFLTLSHCQNSIQLNNFISQLKPNWYGNFACKQGSYSYNQLINQANSLYIPSLKKNVLALNY